MQHMDAAAQDANQPMSSGIGCSRENKAIIGCLPQRIVQWDMIRLCMEGAKNKSLSCTGGFLQ